MQTLKRIGVVGACWLPVLAAMGGPIAPPGGPIAPTMKTLDQVEPRIPIGPDTTPGDADWAYVITQPGSYYLTGTYSLTGQKGGINVRSDNVTIDLMGFRLLNQFNGSTQGISSFFEGEYRSATTVRNGHIARWDGTGVRLGAGSLVEDVVVEACLGNGVRVGAGSVVNRCTVIFTPDAPGIYAGGDAVIESCSVSACSEGIVSSTSAVVSRCIVRACSGDGIRFDGNGGVVSECLVAGCGGEAIATDGVVTGCLALDNDASRAISADVIESCAAIQNEGTGLSGERVADSLSTANNGNGIVVFDGAVGNLSYANTGGSGIVAGAGSLLTSNLASSNGPDHGIDAMDGPWLRIVGNHCVSNASNGIEANLSTVERNSVVRSGDIGIVVYSACSVVGNNAEANANKGFVGVNSRNLFLNNRAANNVARGFEMSANGNSVFGNFARDNGGVNYEAVIGNDFGVIVIPPLSGPITSIADSDNNGSGTTRPFANFSY